MNDGITLHQVLIRFQEPDNCRADFVARLADFTNYDGLVAANNPIEAIDVDIRSYCFDLARIRREMNDFIEKVSLELRARCTLASQDNTYSSDDVVGERANEPTRDVSYTIEIKRILIF